MKIFAAGDIHSDTSLANRLAQEAKEKHADLVILCGDLTYMETSTDGIVGPFVKKKLPVLLIPGNHETVATADFLAELYKVKNIHGDAVKIGDVGIFGAGGANIGLHQISDREVYSLLKTAYQKIKDAKKKVMVTHVHPSDTIMEKLSNVVPGSPGVRRAVDTLKPDILLCSHVHEAEGIEEKIGNTTVINVGKKGRLIEI